MKPIAVIVDFDRTLFTLNVDWQQLKKDVNELLIQEGIRKTNGPFFHYLHKLSKDRSNNKLLQKIRKLLDKREVQGLATGKRLSLLNNLRKLIKSQRELAVIVMTHNNEKLVVDFLEGVWGNLGNKIKVFGRKTLETPPKNSRKALEKVIKYLDEYARGAELIVIGDSWVDREVARSLNVEYLNPKSETFPKTTAQLWQLIVAQANRR